MLAERNSDIEKAVVCLAHLSADDKARRLYESRLKWQRDDMSRMRGAREEGERKATISIASKLLGLGMPIDQICLATGLSADEIAALPEG
jgi:predicted transposase/invertase (TIGR01784 family)